METKQKIPNSQCIVIISSKEYDAKKIKEKLEKISWIESVSFERWIFNPKQK